MPQTAHTVFSLAGNMSFSRLWSASCSSVAYNLPLQGSFEVTSLQTLTVVLQQHSSPPEVDYIWHPQADGAIE